MNRKFYENNGWKVRKLSDLVVSNGIQTGPFGSQLHAYDYTPEGMPVVMPKDMINQRVSTDSIARVSNSTANKLSRHWLQDGDIVFARRGDIGRCAFITKNEEGWLCGTGSLRVRLSQDLASPKFVSYSLSLPQSNQWLNENAVGQTMLNLNSSILSNLPIYLPPLAEQRKIAAILGAWDEAIAAAERLVAVLRERKRGLMQRLLTGRVRFPEFAGRAWQERELRECVEPVSRIAKVQPGQHYNLIGVRWYLEGAHIHDTVSGDNVVTQALSRIHENDILYNKMWVTKAAFAIAKAEHHGAYGTSEYPTFTAKSNLDVRYLEYAFHDPRFLHEARALCRGTTGRARLNPDDFLRLKLLLPDREEQTKIANVLETAQQEIDQSQRQVIALKEQKRGLMQRLLTGQVRVRVDEEQPA